MIVIYCGSVRQIDRQRRLFSGERRAVRAVGRDGLCGWSLVAGDVMSGD